MAALQSSERSSSATSAPRRRSSPADARSPTWSQAARCASAVRRAVQRAHRRRAGRDRRLGDGRSRGRGVAASAPRCAKLRQFRARLPQPARDAAGARRAAAGAIVSTRTIRGDFQMHSTWSDGGERSRHGRGVPGARPHLPRRSPIIRTACRSRAGMSMEAVGAAAPRDRRAERAARGPRSASSRASRRTSWPTASSICSRRSGGRSSSSSRRRTRSCARTDGSDRADARARCGSRAWRSSAIRRGACTTPGRGSRPTGRASSRRPRRAGVAIEIDGNWHRQDIDFELAAQALEAGCLFALDSDAHSIARAARSPTTPSRTRGSPRIPADRVDQLLERRRAAAG